jgi:hypothetical protein
MLLVANVFESMLQALLRDAVARTARVSMQQQRDCCRHPTPVVITALNKTAKAGKHVVLERQLSDIAYTLE